MLVVRRPRGAARAEKPGSHGQRLARASERDFSRRIWWPRQGWWSWYRRDARGRGKGFASRGGGGGGRG
eukprot:3232546-Pleurochrysis_carterae.AAC.1